MWNFCRMDGDSDSFNEENSGNEEEGAGPIHAKLDVKLEESQPPGSPSPVLPSPPLPEGESSPVWELPNDGKNFMNRYTRAEVLELKNWAQETWNRMSQEGYVVEAPLVSLNFSAFLQEHHGQQ